LSVSPNVAGFGAFALDALLAFVVFMPLVLVLGVSGVAAFVALALGPSLAVVLFWRFSGATPGKMAFSLRLAAASGGPLGTARLVARFLAYLVSALPLFLGFAWIAIDRRRQGWHDKIAGTLVIHEE
jgi:uncharacterized RDD family membrane protein YckC